MKIILAGLLLLFSVSQSFSQPQYADSLKKEVLSAKEDSSKVATLGLLSTYYSVLYPDSGIYYANVIIDISTKNNYDYGKALGCVYKGFSMLKQGDFTSSIQLAFKCLNMSKELDEHRLYMMSISNMLIGLTYSVTNNAEKALHYLYTSIELQKQSGEPGKDLYTSYFSLAFSMLVLDKKDSAMLFLNKGWELVHEEKIVRDIRPWVVSGNVNRFSGNLQKAEEYFRKGMELGWLYNSYFFVAAISNDLAEVLYDRGMKDSCIYYLHLCLSLSQKYHYRIFEMNSSSFLYRIYDTLNADSTLKYMKIYVAAKDEIFSQEKMKQFEATSFDEEKKESELANAKLRYESRLRIYIVLGVALVFLIIAFTLFRNNRQKQKANLLLEQQKQKVESTLNELKATQVQLIQSEKMASLGELTAGIAHEIQNPLNFVNNFSELNTEMLEELRAERLKPKLERDDQLEEDIINWCF
jgi:two-component system NtrC family sensor kinase